jgi:hypothetical protein
VRVHVDDPGHECEPARVDYLRCAFITPSNVNNPPVADANVLHAARVAGPVVHRRAADKEIKHQREGCLSGNCLSRHAPGTGWLTGPGRPFPREQGRGVPGPFSVRRDAL